MRPSLVAIDTLPITRPPFIVRWRLSSKLNGPHPGDVPIISIYLGLNGLLFGTGSCLDLKYGTSLCFGAGEN